MALPKEECELLAQYDLSGLILPFLNRHLGVKLYDFLETSGMYDPKQVVLGLIELLKETNLIDTRVDYMEKAGQEYDSNEVDAERIEVLEAQTRLCKEMFAMLSCLEQEDLVKKISGFKSFSDLLSEWNVNFNQEHVEKLIVFGKVCFEIGQYDKCVQVLKGYRKIAVIGNVEERANHPQQVVSATWGCLASSLLDSKYDEAAADVAALHEYMEVSKMPHEEILVNRTWLLHWILFALFTPDKPEEKPSTVDMKLLEHFLSNHSYSVISLAAPHLLRYVAATFILQRRAKHLEKDIVFAIHQERATYNDPSTRFLEALYINVDFDEAQKQLKDCEYVCKADFFLRHHWPQFQENARLLIFEMYCRIHQSINIGMIAEKLNMTAEAAELWIVKLIQDAKLDARIDSENSRVVMCKAPPSVYHQVIEKTRNLSFRSMMMVSNLDKRERDCREGTVTVY